MAKHPNLSQIEDIMKKGNNFSMTEEEYERSTGAPLPKGDSYLQKKSAVAKRAKDVGFQIGVSYEAVRTVRFVKQ